MLKIRYRKKDVKTPKEDNPSGLIRMYNKISREVLKKRVSKFDEKINLKIPDSQILLVTGTNGCGKSTFLQQLYLSVIHEFGMAMKDKRINIFADDKEIEFKTEPPAMPNKYGDPTDYNKELKTTSYQRRYCYDKSHKNLLIGASNRSIRVFATIHNSTEAFATNVFMIKSDCKYMPYYFDSTIMGLPDRKYIRDLREGEDGYVSPALPKSHRQWFKTAFEGYLKSIRETHPGKPILFIIDEPENGLDCESHQNLEGMIRKTMTNPKDIAIIATNSPFLIYSSLPRIDLDSKTPFKIYYGKKRIKIE